MRDLPNHAKIKGIITTCTHSSVREGFLEGSWEALTPTWTKLGCAASARSKLCCTDSTELVACAGCHVNLVSCTQAPRKTPSPPCSMLRLVHVWLLWCVAPLVYLLLMLVCVCGPACCACCGMLQRRHNFDAFLKRLGTY